MLHQVNKEIFQETRISAFQKAQNYYLAAWNEWVTTRVFVKDAAKYLLSSDNHGIDIAL